MPFPLCGRRFGGKNVVDILGCAGWSRRNSFRLLLKLAFPLSSTIPYHVITLCEIGSIIHKNLHGNGNESIDIIFHKEFSMEIPLSEIQVLQFAGEFSNKNFKHVESLTCTWIFELGSSGQSKHFFRLPLQLTTKTYGPSPLTSKRILIFF